MSAKPNPIDAFVDANQKWLGLPEARAHLGELALANVLSHEIRPSGEGFVNHPDDPGGATNWGISLRFLREFVDLDAADPFTREAFDKDGDGDLDPADMRAMTIDEAMAIYRAEFWENTLLSRLPPRMAVKMMDMAVNMGQVQATKLLQRVINSFGPGTKLAVDGILGPLTLEAAWEVMLDSGREGEGVDHLRAAAARFYQDLVQRNDDFRSFIRGWLRRAAS